MIVVEVWKDGYASDNKGRAVIEDGKDPVQEVRRLFGPYAIIYHQYPLHKPMSEKFDLEYVRQMSIGG